MSFEPARGLDFPSFCKVVKTMRLVVLTGTNRYETDWPLQMYNIPIYNIQVEIPEN
jgi:hypothetical protein